MERIFNLSFRGKVFLIFMLLMATAAIGGILFFLVILDFDEKVIAVPAGLLGALMPVIALASLMFFSEKKEDIALIAKNIDFFLDNVVPTLINGRFVGEPFDKNAAQSRFRLRCEKFHQKNEPHAGYRVRVDDLTFEFTCVLNVYRMTLFMFVPRFETAVRKKAVEDVCENLINSGFKFSVEKVSDPSGRTKGHAVILLRKEFTDRPSDFIFSAREQSFIAREIAEWCRSIIRKLKYDATVFAVLPVPFSQLLPEPSPEGAAQRAETAGIGGLFDNPQGIGATS